MVVCRQGENPVQAPFYTDLSDHMINLSQQCPPRNETLLQVCSYLSLHFMVLTVLGDGGEEYGTDQVRCLTCEHASSIGSTVIMSRKSWRGHLNSSGHIQAKVASDKQEELAKAFASQAQSAYASLAAQLQPSLTIAAPTRRPQIEESLPAFEYVNYDEDLAEMQQFIQSQDDTDNDPEAEKERDRQRHWEYQLLYFRALEEEERAFDDRDDTLPSVTQEFQALGKCYLFITDGCILILYDRCGRRGFRWRVAEC
jgi:hypothetical protein